MSARAGPYKALTSLFDFDLPQLIAMSCRLHSIRVTLIQGSVRGLRKPCAGKKFRQHCRLILVSIECREAGFGSSLVSMSISIAGSPAVNSRILFRAAAMRSSAPLFPWSILTAGNRVSPSSAASNASISRSIRLDPISGVARRARRGGDRELQGSRQDELRPPPDLFECS
jgi:hypothetical protein